MEHSFDIEIATKFGLIEAILLNNIWWWVEKNKANGNNYYDGNYWTYNSTKAFAELFPYVSQKQIQNALKNLINEGILITGNYNKSVYDRTLWYAFTEKGKCIMQKRKMEDEEMSNGICKIVKPIPNINTDNINTNNKQNNRPSNQQLEEENDNKKYKLGIPDGYQRETQYSIGKYSIVKDSIEKNNNNAQRKKELEEEFEQLWSMYPNKKGKTNALKAYIKARGKYSFEEIEQGIRNYIFYIKESGIDPQFIKHGSTWFNQQCWNDDYTVYKKEEKQTREEKGYAF